MYVLTLNMWFQKLMRQFFFAIDKIVYNFISDIYDLLISIARTSVLTQADIIDMADRIYKLLAVFMVFKVTFSLIMYVVNPDDFSDKSKGVSKLVTNIGMSLSLLILTPYIFNYAYQLQTIVLEDNSLAALVFGEDANADESHFSTAGDDMAYITISPFFSPNLSLTSLYVCSDLSVIDSDGKRKFNSDCKSSMESLFDDKTGFDSVTLNNYVTGFEHKSLGLMYRQDMAIATTTKGGLSSEEFVMDYKYIFSTVVGIVLVLLLLSFCMDVAVRSIKLAFLQLVAPIPIISIIDPKSGKDGLFKKWYQMCFKTYLSLFIRLIALYFAVYIISKVAEMKMVDIVDGSYVSNGFISIFIIIGALMFAKQLPKMLEGLGIKLDGDSKFTLNPLKKFSDNALGGKKILGFGAAGAAAALAGGVNMASRTGQLFNRDTWKNAWRDKNGKVTIGSIGRGIGTLFSPATSAIAGTTSAAFRGTRKTLNGEKAGKIFSNSYGEAMFAKLQREDLTRKGSTIHGRIAADFNRLTGNLNAAQQQTLDYANLEQEYKMETEMIKHRQEEIKRERQQKAKVLTDKNKALSAINTRITNTKSVKDAQEKVDSLKSSGKFYATAGTLNAAGIAAQEQLDNKKSEYQLEESKISDQIALNNKQISDMKSLGNYYKKDSKGNLLRVEGGKPVLTEEAQLVENELKSNVNKLDNISKIHKDEITIEESKIKNNSSYLYKEGDLTIAGEMADKELDKQKLKAFNNLQENDAEVKTYMKQLEEADKQLMDDKYFNETDREELNLKTEDYIKSDGSFNKKAMFDVQNAISALEAKDYPEEAELAEQLRTAQQNFEDKLEETGLDKDSKQWKSNEANNAARKVKNPQPEGWMPSADVDARSYGQNIGLTGFTPPPSGGPGSGHQKHRRR